MKRDKRQTKRERRDVCPGGSGGVCPKCGRCAVPPPLGPLDAALTRLNHLAAGIERADGFAYVHARSTVMVTRENARLRCDCDIRNWNRAWRDYLRRGAQWCWESLGVTPELMREAELVRAAQFAEQRLLEQCAAGKAGKA